MPTSHGDTASKSENIQLILDSCPQPVYWKENQTLGRKKRRQLFLKVMQLSSGQIETKNPLPVCEHTAQGFPSQGIGTC